MDGIKQETGMQGDSFNYEEHKCREKHKDHKDHKDHRDHGGYCWNISRDGEKRHGHREHGHREHMEDSLVGLLCRCGYIADRKSGRQRGQKRILGILLDSPEISQKELLDKLNIEPGSMSEVLSKMEDKGLIRREKDAADRRKLLITLTEEGKKAAEDCGDNMEESMLNILSEEEKEELKRILGKLLEQWKTERRRR